MRRTGFILAAAVLLCIVTSCTVNGQTALGDYLGVLQLNLAGTQSAAPLLNLWAFGYSFATGFANVSYTPLSNPVALIAMSNSPYLMGVVDDYDIAAAFEANLTVLPFGAFGVALPMRLSGINGASVVLDMNTIGAIYMGNVTFWDDPTIALLNPNLTLPHTPIYPIVYDVPSPATGVFSQALAQVVSGWNSTVVPPVGSSASFPIEDDANTLTCNSTDAHTFLNVLNSVDGSIGFALYSDFLYYGLTYAQQIRVKRSANSTVVPTQTTITNAMTSFDSVLRKAPSLNGPIVNSPDLTTWPFASLMYNIFSPANVVLRCQAEISATEFYTWTQINPGAMSYATKYGYSVLSLAVRNSAQDSSASLNCNGDVVLSQSVIIGMGPNYLKFIMEGWARVYTTSQAQSDTYINYLTQTQAFINNAVVTAGTKFVATGDIYPTSVYMAAPDLLQFPTFAYGLAQNYYIPELLGEPPLVMTVQMVAAIWNNDITHWNDPQIIAINSDPAYCTLESPCVNTSKLPDQPIILLNRTDSSVVTLVFTQTLSAMSTYPTTAASQVWWKNLPSERVVNGVSITLITIITSIPYCFTYTPYPRVLGEPTASKIGNVRIVNRQNNAVSPFKENVLAAVYDYVNNLQEYNPPRTNSSNQRRQSVDASSGSSAPPPSLVGSLIAGPGENSYPFSAYAYLAIRTQSSATNCRSLSRFLDFVLWTQTYTTAENAVGTFGGAKLPVALNNRVLTTLATLECGGVPALNIAGCLRDGIICSNSGGCVDGGCLCRSGFSGTYCEDSSSSSSDNSTIYIAVFVTIIPLLLCICCIIAIVVILMLIFIRPNEKAWAVDFQEIELKQQIGAGGYGAVHKAIWKDSDVAVKLLANTIVLNREMKNNFVSEVKIMTQLRHPNVILFMGACTKPPNLCIIMEYMELGSLYDVLHNELVPMLPMNLRIKLGLQAAQGMHFLHSSGILHRDLKSPNILLDDKWNAKISDFGLTKFKADSSSDIDKLAGSLYWTAPEILGEEQPFSDPSDVYSFGIVLWELLTAKDPYEGMNPTTVAVSVLRDDMRPKMPQNVIPDYKDLIENCWDKQTDVRPTFLEVVTRLKAMASSTSTDSHSSRNHRHSTTVSVDSISRLDHDTMSTSGSDAGNAGRLGAIDKAVHAPTGEVVIVCTHIHRAGALWEYDPVVMKDATVLHNDLLRQAMLETFGYEVHSSDAAANDSSEGSFMVAFQELADAIRWTVMVQERLMKAEWAETLLIHPAAAEEMEGADDEIVHRGLRVKMGIHIGAPRTTRDPLTRRIEYHGPMVEKTANLASMAHGGQILVSSSIYKAAKLRQAEFEQLVVFTIADQEKTLYEMKPATLKNRFFGGTVSIKSRENSTEFLARGIKTFTSLDGSESSYELEETTDGTHKLQVLNSANMCRWIINFDDVTLGRQIGLGSYGIVYKARWKAVDVAVKRLVKQKLSERQLLDFRAEVAFLSEMHHPNIVLFIGACVKQPNLCIVTEYVKQGSLKDILANKSIKISWDMRMKIAKGAALGIYYLHSLAPVIMHRDLKSSNILIDENWNAKVADFGFARIKQDNATMTRCGSPCWTAPEVITGQKYTEKADVYSFGIILWEILTRQQPYKGLNYMNVGLEVVQGTRPKIPGNTPKQFAKLVSRCWRGEADKRPSMEKVVAYFDKEESLSSAATDNEQLVGNPVDTA